MTVSLALKQARRAKGWSQTVMAELAAVSPNTVRLLEKGHDVRLSTIAKIAEALECELSVQTRHNSHEHPQDVGVRAASGLRS